MTWGLLMECLALGLIISLMVLGAVLVRQRRSEDED